MIQRLLAIRGCSSKFKPGSGCAAEEQDSRAFGSWNESSDSIEFPATAVQNSSNQSFLIICLHKAFNGNNVYKAHWSCVTMCAMPSINSAPPPLHTP